MIEDRKIPIEDLLPKVVYMHYLDNTDGIVGNVPEVTFTDNKQNPFGKPGKDYSEEYPWKYIKLIPEVK